MTSITHIIKAYIFNLPDKFIRKNSIITIFRFKELCTRAVGTVQGKFTYLGQRLRLAGNFTATLWPANPAGDQSPTEKQSELTPPKTMDGPPFEVKKLTKVIMNYC